MYKKRLTRFRSKFRTHLHNLEVKWNLAKKKEVIVAKLQRYFADELDQEIGQFDVLFLLAFFEKEIGAFFYNQGLQEAQALMKSKLEAITDGFYELEMPTN